MECRIFKLNQIIIDWVSYFGLADMKIIAAKLDGWIRRRIRMCF
jgi:RNA-directed DNA polymerase